MNLPAEFFPPLPALSAQGVAVFLEPVLGSGERLCVGVAARVDQQRHHVVPLLHTETAKCLVGVQADALLGLVQTGLDSLEHHLGSGAHWDSWKPPFHGLTLSQQAEGSVDSVEMMLRTLARNHSFLSAMADFSGVDAPMETLPEGNAEEDWVKRVRRIVEQRTPHLDGHFARRVTLFSETAPTRFDYLGARLVAQLGRLIPGAQLGRHLSLAKAKLWDLESLRDAGCDELMSADRFELLLYRPGDNDPSYADKQLENMRRALKTLEEAGDKQRLRVRPVETAEQAASLIIEAEAA